jgi:hypothetical protein
MLARVVCCVGVEYRELNFNPKPKPVISSVLFYAYPCLPALSAPLSQLHAWKVHKALIKAKLEPYLGFLHSVQHGKPSLVCDFMELYRYLIDDVLIDHCRKLNPKDFIVKTENLGRKKQGKREYLSNQQTRELMKKLELYLENIVDIPRIKVGKKQTIETLINEEALLFAEYLRKQNEIWIPRSSCLTLLYYIFFV